MRVLKTLIALVDGRPACVMLASDREVSMKKLAAALGAKSAEMMKPADAERISGYRVGGVSPLRPDAAGAGRCSRSGDGGGSCLLNGGQRGLQARLKPQEAAALLKAVVAPLVA